MSFIDDQIDDYVNYRITEDYEDFRSYEEEDGNEQLSRYYGRSETQRRYDKYLELYK